jgi:hypothetical protein
MADAVRWLMLPLMCSLLLIAPESSARVEVGSNKVKLQKTQMMMGGWHFNSSYGRQFLSGTAVTIQGTVSDVGAFSPGPRMTRGSRLILKTDKGLITVHLGPNWYIQEQELKFEKGQRLEIEGRQIGSGESAFVIASKITHGKNTWILRDAEGIPNWCAVRPTGPLNPQETPPEKSQKNQN